MLAVYDVHFLGLLIPLISLRSFIGVLARRLNFPESATAILSFFRCRTYAFSYFDELHRVRFSPNCC